MRQIGEYRVRSSSRGIVPQSILLFEDNSDIRELVSSLLTEEGYALLQVRSLDEAERLVREDGISLVLADSGEATKEGALKTYRRYCRTISSRVPMIVFTAHRLSDEETQELGCVAVLTKPFDIDRLLDLIAEQLPPEELQPSGSA